MKQCIVIVVTAFVLAGCSSVETNRSFVSLNSIRQSERLQLLVQTGNASLDRYVYELAQQKFGDLLPLREKPPYTGTVEITFTSASQSSVSLNASTQSSGVVGDFGWYNGAGYVGQAARITAGSAASTTTITTGPFVWQNSIMLIVVKNEDGARLWSADYNYKGGWEMSGFVVNTPEEAARLVLTRLRDKFIRDYSRAK